MTEIMLAGREMHNNLGRPMLGPENFHEVFARAMRDILANPRGKPRQTIPAILCRDKTLCSKPTRHWLNNPDRSHPERRVWRIFVDIGRLGTGDDDEKLQLRRCNVTGRHRGEFGSDPDLENYGWGPDDGDDSEDDSDGGDDDEDDGGDGGGDGDGDGDGDGGDDGDGHHAGENDGQDDDGDSGNGGWGRGFGRSRHKTPPRKGSLENEDGAGVEADAKGNGKSNIDSVTKLWAQICTSLGLPSNTNDEEVNDLVKKLQYLRKHYGRKQRQQLATPSSSGVQKRARQKKRIPVDAEGRGRSEAAIRLRGNSPATSDCEITSVRRFGHELESPIDLSAGATIPIEISAPPSTRRTRIINWLGDFLPKSPEDLFSEKDDDKAFIKRSDSPAPLPGGSSAFGGRNPVEREVSADPDLEITSARPINRPWLGGGFIDLTDTAIDLTGDPE